MRRCAATADVQAEPIATAILGILFIIDSERFPRKQMLVVLNNRSFVLPFINTSGNRKATVRT